MCTPKLQDYDNHHLHPVILSTGLVDGSPVHMLKEEIPVENNAALGTSREHARDISLYDQFSCNKRIRE